MGPKEYVAVDAMVFSYLLQANTTDSDPTLDSDKALAAERLAIQKIWRSQRCDVFIPPTISKEILRINQSKPGTLPKTTLLDQHRRTRDCFVLEILHLDAVAVDQMAQGFLQYHSDPDDCYVVAESECAEMDVLLTFDTCLLKHLRNRTVKLSLLTPTAYQAELRKRYGSL